MKGFAGFMHNCHKIVGLIAILPVLLLILTGLLLEFREGLQLHDRYPKSQVVLWLYGSDHLGQETGADLGFEDGTYSIEPASYERVLTAFHAGKFRGHDTRFLLVISAFTLLALSLTGPYLWLKSVFFKRRRRHGILGEGMRKL